MLKIFHAPRSRSNRAVWLLEEMGAPYECVPVALGAPKPPEIALHNPADTLPLMIDGETVLFESITIMEYIAETYGPTPLALPSGHPDHWPYRQMLVFGEATLAGPLNAIIGTMFRAPDEASKQNYTMDVVRTGFGKRIGVVAKQLETGPYMAGEAFTLADISVGYGVNLATIEVFGLKPMIPENVLDYLKRLTDRPAYQRMTEVK